MTVFYNRFALNITRGDALAGSHAGRCDDDIADLRRKPSIRRQLDKLDPADLADELQEYGSWDGEALADHDANLTRILWIACCDIRERIRS